MIKNALRFIIVASLLLPACALAGTARLTPTPSPSPETDSVALSTHRPNYNPGELVDYAAQTGDTLPALAARFNTTVEEIRAANPFIPEDATTMPPGMPMKIPIYYLALWADHYQIIPDHAFVNGPTLIGFNTAAFVASRNGWLKDYRAYAGGDWRSGAGIVDYVSVNFSVSPRLLLALLEYQTGALSNPVMPKDKNLLGFHKEYYDTLYLQLVQAADILNDSYYRWRTGDLLEFELLDGSLFRPDPWDNAASVSLKRYFSLLYNGDQFTASIGPSGLARAYTDLFGDPWQDPTVLIPGSLRQPELPLPFQAGQVWSYTGGPHTGYGASQPYPAVDFAPPSDKSGCFVAESKYYVIALADGMIARSETGTVVLDLDGDGNERTGWVIYYLHIAGRVPLGLEVKRGDPIGYPSCEGGHVTGTHVHIARKYNGEWIPADGPLAFVMDGWTVHAGYAPYKGTLTKGSLIVTACECGDLYSQVRAGLAP
jgi:murein DD-endopeptidase MepM/ murein hydrolase activator NlpD